MLVKIIIPSNWLTRYLITSRHMEAENWEAFNAVQLDATDKETLDLLDPGTPFINFLTATAIGLLGRCLFSTPSGQLGFGTSTLQKDDVLCVFDGARTPHILRRTLGTNGDVYSLIGEAYVHGMMNGEVEDLGLERQDVILV